VHEDEEWKQRMRAARAPPSMEGSRRLWLPFINGVHTCLKEGAHLARRSYTWRIADLFVSVER
jgi:cytochrome P450